MNAGGADRGTRRAGVLGLALALALPLGAACSSSDDGGSPTRATKPDRTGGNAADGSNVFTDPEGTYEMRIGAEWEEQPGRVVAEIEAWAVDDPVGGFVPNVNVLTQDAPGMDLSEYLDFSAESASQVIPEAEIIENRIIDGASGGKLALLDYTGPQAGIDLHYLAVVAVTNGTAVVATLTAPESVFDELRGEIESLLLTLRPLSR